MAAGSTPNCRKPNAISSRGVGIQSWSWGVLEQVAHLPGQPLFGHPGDLLPRQPDFPGAGAKGGDELFDKLQQGGFSAAGAPQQQHKLSLLHLKSNLLQRRMGYTGIGKGQVPHRKQGLLGQNSRRIIGRHGHLPPSRIDSNGQ